MRNPKNNFYRKLRLDKDIFEVIKFYNNIKKKMLKEDLDNQGYSRKKREK